MESAKDIKKSLESPPVIAGTSIAECKIDQSAMSAGAANNKIQGILLKACACGKLTMLERAYI